MAALSEGEEVPDPLEPKPSSFDPVPVDPVPLVPVEPVDPVDPVPLVPVDPLAGAVDDVPAVASSSVRPWPRCSRTPPQRSAPSRQLADLPRPSRAEAHPVFCVPVDGVVVGVVVVVVVVVVVLAEPRDPPGDEPLGEEPVGEDPAPAAAPEPEPEPVNPHVVSAWDRSAASCCWSADDVAWIAHQSALILGDLTRTAPGTGFTPGRRRARARRGGRGRRRGRGLPQAEVSLSSSSVSCASSDATVDSAEDTDSASDVVSSVASDSPAVTCSPTVAVTVATWPATWNEAVASLTGSTVPTTSWVLVDGDTRHRGGSVARITRAADGKGRGAAGHQDGHDHDRPDDERSAPRPLASGGGAGGVVSHSTPHRHTPHHRRRSHRHRRSHRTRPCRSCRRWT